MEAPGGITGLSRHDPDGDSSYPLDRTLSGLSNAGLRGMVFWEGYWRVGQSTTISPYTETDFAEATGIADITIPIQPGG